MNYYEKERDNEKNFHYIFGFMSDAFINRRICF